MKKFIALLLALCVLMSLAACGSQEPSAENPTSTPADPGNAGVVDDVVNGNENPSIPTGGSLIIAENMDPVGFVSVVTSERGSASFSAPLYPMLLNYDVYNNMAPVTSELVESYDFVDDKILTFHLRDDAYWTDGEAIDAYDVEFTINKLMIPYSPFAGQFLKTMESCVATDAYTVVITMSEAFPNLPNFWHRHYCQIYPEHIWKDYTENYTECPEYSNPKTTGGAWVLDEYVPGEYATYSPNPTYYKVGQPYLDQLVIRIIPDSDTQVAALEAGEIDVILPQLFPVTEAARVSTIDGLSVSEYGFDYAAVIYELFLNHEDPYLSDINVRRAVSHAIDKEAVVSDLLAGYGVPLDSYLPTGAVWDPYIVTPEYVYDYDVDKANKILDEAGYEKDANGSRGITLKFCCMNNTTIIKYGEIIKSYLDKVGIAVEISTMETGSFIENVCIGGDYSMCCVDMAASLDFSVEARIFTSDRIGVAFGNMFRYSNPRLDEIFAGLASATGDEKLALYAEMQNILAEDCTGIFIQSKPCQAFSSNFGNLPATPHAQKEDYDDVYFLG